MTEGSRIRRRAQVTTVNDSRLSFNALGMLAWIFSRPPGEALHVESIAATSPRDQLADIQDGLRELVQFGYLTGTADAGYLLAGEEAGTT